MTFEKGNVVQHTPRGFVFLLVIVLANSEDPPWTSTGSVTESMRSEEETHHWDHYPTYSKGGRGSFM